MAAPSAVYLGGTLRAYASVVTLLGAGCGVGALRGRGRAAEGDVEFLELVFRDGAGGVHHLVAGRLGLGEGHDLADVRLVAEDHDQAVYPRRYAPVRRGAVAEGREHGAEAPLGLLCPDADHVEDPLLDVGAGNSDDPRRELGPVRHEVVELPY